MNIKQFNGKYGCPACLHPGQYIKTQVYAPGRFSIRTCDGIDRAIQCGNKRV